MELRSVEVFDFSELKDEVKEKVLNAFRERNDCNFLEESLTESLNALLEENKIKALSGLSLRYSLGCSQGDGLSFIGYFKFKGFDFNISLGQNSNLYSHSHTTDINTDDDSDHDGDITEELREVTEKEFKEIYFEICYSLEKEGYNFIEAENSEETIKENIEANEYKFLANGEIF